jgi:uncharacterized protein (TIGR00255 family)
MMSKPLLSMTGFGRSVRQAEGVTIEVEIRCVNHRFLDLNIKLPKLYTCYEVEVRKQLSEALSRGRVDLAVVRRATDNKLLSVQFNRDLYEKLLLVYADLVPNNKERAQFDILSRHEVLDIVEDSALPANESVLLYESISEALVQVQQMRIKEGQVINNDLISRLQQLEALRSQIEIISVKSPQEYRDKLSQRVQRLAPEVVLDPARLAAEVALMCERIDVTEELVRLGSHFAQFRQTISDTQGAGRKLDFLTQEIGREFNTITSKAQDASIQHLVIEAKSQLEKIKEQIQNVE